MGYNVHVDREKCQGHGKCAQLAPHTFSLDASNTVVLGDAAATQDEVLVRAAKSCPYRVISVGNAEGGQIFPPIKKAIE